MKNLINKTNNHPLIPKNQKNFSEESFDNDDPNKQFNDLFDSSIIKNRPFLDRPGKIKYAKRHASADRPLHKIKNFTKETDFCQCCNLPCETKGVIEPFKICDSTDKFSECGLGIALFFYYFRFCIICLSIVFIMMALPMIIFNKYYSNEINTACDNIFNQKNITICKKYLGDSELYNQSFVFLIPFSSDSITDYFKYWTEMNENQSNIKKTIINYIILDIFPNFILFITGLYFLFLLRIRIDKEKSMNCSPSDYTLFISNMNNALDYYEDYCISKKKIVYNDKERFKDFITFLKNKIIYTKKKSDEIYDINFCYILKDFMKSGRQIKKINYQLLQIVNNFEQKQYNNKYGLYGEKRRYFELCCGCNCKKGLSIKKLLRNREINQIKINYLLKNSKILTKNTFTGSIFVTFNTIQQKEEYYSKYNKNIFLKILSFFKEAKYYCCCCCIEEKSKNRFFRRKRISVSSAFEPEDIIWENIGYDKWFRFKRLFLIYTFSLLLLFISFLIVLGLTYLREYSMNKKVTSYIIIRYGISLLITASICIINEIFYFLLEKLTKKEKQISMTNFYLSYSIKLTLFNFVSYGIVPLVCNKIENGKENHYEYLVDDVLLIFLANSFGSPLLWTFDFIYIYKKIKICLLERKKEPDLKHNKTQRELNKLYQLPDMNISYKYSYVAKTILLSLFYIPIFPFGIVISLVGFILAYYLELYNFTHLYRKPEMINERICLFYIEYFVMNLFFFNLGVYIFIKDIFSIDFLLIIFLVIFGILSIFPFTKLINCECLKVPKNILLNTTQYEDIYFSFYNDYQRQNPMTKIDGLKNYITKLRINGYISQKVYNFAYMNIDTINVMELYYRSKLNRNIVQSQIALANYNSNSYRDSLRKSMKRKTIGIDKEKKAILGSAIYDEQLTNLLKKSIYKQKFGNKLDDLNKILANKKIFSSSNNNMEIDLEKESSNKEDENKSESTLNEKNKDYILKQYDNPFLLSISHNITNGDLSMFRAKDKRQKNLEKIKEASELNENIDENTGNEENKKDKSFYGVDFDIYSERSSFSEKSKNKGINIEMQDLSERKNNIKYNYEMSEYNTNEKNKNNYERIKQINVKYKNNKKLKNNKKNTNEELSGYFQKNYLNKDENNYDGDYDSDNKI